MERLSHESVVAVSNAAMQSLRLLHECGILHGDIDLRNLRAQRVTSGDEKSVNVKGQNYWRCWWIDLGKAQDGISSDLERELELALCNHLFLGSNNHVIISSE